MRGVHLKSVEGKSCWGLIGAVISAIVASICCLGPLFLLAIGVSGAWISSLTTLSPYRPFFMIIALVFLGVAFYIAYRKPKTNSCAIGSSCGTPLGKRMYIIILWIVTILIIGLLAFPYLVPYVFAEGQTTGTMRMEQVVLEVKNMYCISCPVAVKKSLTPVIHHQLLDGRVFRTFRNHSIRSRSGYPLKNAMTTSNFLKFAETTCDVSLLEHTSASGRKNLLQKSTTKSTQYQ